MANIVVEVPEELKAVGEAMREMVAAITAQVALQRTGRCGYESFERRLEEKSAAVERAAHVVALTALDVDAPAVELNGVRHTQVLRGPATFRTRVGDVEVTRSLFRPSAARGGAAVDLVALRAGAVEGTWLPSAARAMAHLLQQSPAREAVRTAQELGRLPYAKASFERVGQAVAALYVGREKEIDEALIHALAVPGELASVSAALDRVSIPVEEPRTRPRPVGRPRKGAPKNLIARVYRMAYCGTVTLHDQEGRALHTIRYGCMPDSDPDEIVNGMAGDVLALRGTKKGLPVALLSDGAPEMHRRLDDAFAGEEFGVVVRLIDFWHLVEKLAAAAAVVVSADEKRELVARWRMALLNRSSARVAILEELRASGKEHVRVGDEAPVHDAITYLENNADRMDFAAARQRNLPIGSGAVEATCKSLVTVRMKRSGCRWKQASADRLIRIRALALSDRWSEAMELTLQPPPARVKELRAA